MSYKRRCRHCGRTVSLRQMPHGKYVAFEGGGVHDCAAPPAPQKSHRQPRIRVRTGEEPKDRPASLYDDIGFETFRLGGVAPVESSPVFEEPDGFILAELITPEREEDVGGVVESRPVLIELAAAPTPRQPEVDSAPAALIKSSAADEKLFTPTPVVPAPPEPVATPPTQSVRSTEPNAETYVKPPPPVIPPRARRSSAWPWVLGSSAILGLVLWLVVQGSSPAAAPPRAANSLPVTVALTSDPSPATVYVEGVYRGETPLNLQVPSAVDVAYRVEAEASGETAYEPFAGVLNVRTSDAVSVWLNRVALPSDGGDQAAPSPYYPPRHAVRTAGGWECVMGYEQVAGQCEKLTLPANAHFAGQARWACDWGYAREGESCVLREEQE